MRKEIQGRILIIAFLGDPTLPAGILSTGGFNQTLSELVEYLATLPYYFTIITDVSAYATTPSEEISSNIELYRVYLSADEHRNQNLLRDATPRILIECKKIISDALHEYFLIHSFYWFSGNVAHYISQETHIPFIHTPISLAYEKIANGITPKSVWQLPCETQFLKTAEYILAITEAERDVLIKHYMTSRTKIIVVGRSVNEIFRFPVRDRSGVPRTLYEQRRNFTTKSNCFDAHWWSPMAFTYLGRLEAVKGVDHIIRA